MAKASGSIDLRAMKEAHDDASTKATNYIEADENGIKVHNADDLDNYALLNSDGMNVHKDGNSVALFGTRTRIGEENGARVEIDSDTIQVLTEDGVEAFSVESSTQDAPQRVRKTLSDKVAKNSTQTVTLSILDDAVSDTFVYLYYTYRYYNDGIAEGSYVSTKGSKIFTKGTSGTETITYTEKASSTATTRTITIVYDGAKTFTITNPSPYFTFDLTSIFYTMQSAPRPETNFNGLFYLNGVNVEQPVLDTTTLTPYSNRCDILDGGIWRFGKWRFVQINVQINDVTLSANNTWALLDGLANDLPATYGRATDNTLARMANLSASAQRNAGDISAYINGNGRIVVATSDNALTVNNVVMISGFYIAK